MSFTLIVKQVTNIKLQGQSPIEAKMTLVVQNSKSGALLQSKIKFNRLEWDKPYSFLTGIDDNVDFVLVKGDEKQAQMKENIVGKGKLYTKKFFKMFQHKIVELQKEGLPISYEITLFRQTKNEQIVTGIVKLDIEYDSNKHYQGQVISNADLDLRGEVHTNPRFVKFYLGQSSKVNIFSLFDDKANNQKFRFIESIYKDLE